MSEETTRGGGKAKSKKSVPKGKNYLLAIAIDGYEEFRPLSNAVSDAKEFVEILQDRYDFQEEHIITCFEKEATRSGIWQTFREVKEKLKSYVSSRNQVSRK